MKVQHKHTKETFDNVFDCGWCYVGIACVNSENKIVMVEKQYYEPISDEEPIWCDVTEACVTDKIECGSFIRHGERTLASMPDDYRLRKVPNDLGRQGTGWAFIIEHMETA